MSECEVAWAALKGASVGSARYMRPTANPLANFAMLSPGGDPVLAFWCSTRPPKLDLGAAVQTEIRYQQQRQQFLLILTLVDSEVRDTFSRLCDHLLQAVDREDTEEQALRALVAAVKNWRRLFRRAPQLSPEEYRGLWAEAWYGARQLRQRFPMSEIARAWARSATTPQDFYLPGPERHEVKSILPAAKTIAISSVEQLDPKDGDVLLSVVELQEASPDKGDTLEQLVQEWLDALPAEDSHLVERVLTERGYARPTDDEVEPAFTVNALRLYDVDTAFPSFRSADIPPGVMRVQYELSLDDISGHMSTEGDHGQS